MKLKQYVLVINFDAESQHLVEEFAKGFCQSLNEEMPPDLIGKMKMKGFLITKKPK